MADDQPTAAQASAPNVRSTNFRIEIAPRTIFYVALAFAAAWIIRELWTVWVILIVALVLVGTFDPLVGWFERRGIRRGRALVVVFFIVALMIAGILAITVPPLLAQVQHIVENLPAERLKVIAFLNQYKWAAPFIKAIRAVPLEQSEIEAGVTVASQWSLILTDIGYAVTTIFLALYLLADPGRARGAIYAVVPRHHHVKLARILLELETIVGGYMRGQLITSAAISVFTFALLSAFHVADALALALFAGLTDIIPFVGGYLASAPAIIAVSGMGGVPIAIVTIAMFAYQEFESRILVPRVYGRVLRLSPAVVLVALLIGGTLLGVLGALLALPIAAGLRMVVRELRVELPGDVPPSEIERARDEKVEEMYEKLAAGQPLEEASAIAGELAQKLKEPPPENKP